MNLVIAALLVAAAAVEVVWVFQLVTSQVRRYSFRTRAAKVRYLATTGLQTVLCSGSLLVVVLLSSSVVVLICT